MTHIDSVILEGPDPDALNAFYRAAFGLTTQVRVRASEEPSSGFRGFTMSLVVPQPNVVDLFIGSALEAGATPVKPVAKSLWGYGGVVRAPDGSLWKVATSSKKDKGGATRTIDDLVLLLGAADVKASKRFYVDHGLTVKRSFGGKYAEFDTPGSPIKLALYAQRALAKDAGVAPDGSGSRRMAIRSSDAAFTDPDGFAWETTSVPASVGSPAEPTLAG